MNIKWISLLTFTFGITNGIIQAGPIIVGNGGDSVHCTESQDNILHGYYALDYLLTFQNQNQNADIKPVNDWESSRDRILKILENKHPDLALSFKNYLNSYGNFTDWTRARIWQEASYGLVDIKDERIVRRLPKNCLVPGSDGNINLIQTVVRVPKPDSIVYEVDLNILNDLLMNNPLQASFILVHEWLWDLTSDVQVIRDLNRYLHSDDALASTPEQFKKAILHIGVDFSSMPFRSICMRQAAVRMAIESALGIRCESLTYDELKNIRRDRSIDLKITSAVGESFDFNEFADLVFPSSFDLSGLDLKTLYAHQFKGNPRLQFINLSHNKITTLPNDFLLEEAKLNLWKVDLSHNQLTTIPHSVLTAGIRREPGAVGSYIVDLSHNLITSLPENGEIPTPAGGTLKIILSHNRLSTMPADFIFKFLKGTGTSAEIYFDNNNFSDATKEAIINRCREEFKIKCYFESNIP